MKTSKPAPPAPLAYTFKMFYETVVPMSRAKANQLAASGELETFLINNRRYVTRKAADNLIAKKVAAGGAVPPEVSAQKSAAGRKGRSAQLQAADHPEPA